MDIVIFDDSEEQRRRKISGGAVLVCVATIFSLSYLFANKDRRASISNIPNWGDVERKIVLLEDGWFKRMYRLRKETFEMLSGLLSSRLKSKNLKNHKLFIPVRVKLAATMRYLAGGSYIDICFALTLDLERFIS